MSKDKDFSNVTPTLPPEAVYSIDGFLGISRVVRNYNAYLIHGFVAWMREKDPTFLGQSHTLQEWETFYLKYVKS